MTAGEEKNEAVSPAERLRDACAQGDLDAVCALLDGGADVNARNEKGKTPVYYAAKTGAVHVLLELVDHGADLHVVTAKQRTALHQGAKHGGAATVRFLLEQGLPIDAVDTFGWSVFHYAAAGGDIDVIQLLIERGVDIEATTNVRGVATALANFSTMKGNAIPRGESVGKTALHLAARFSTAAAVRFLLDQGLDISAVQEDGMSVFHFAAMAGDIEIMKLLIERGADIHATTADGRGALLFAVQNKKAEAVQLLLDQGLSVATVTNKGYTPLHYAVMVGDAGLMQLLIERGADVHATTAEGGTALHYAAQHGRTEIMKILLTHGLSIDAITDGGITAFHHAALGGDINTMAVLMDHGADIHKLSENKRSALHFAVLQEKVDAVNFLVEQGLKTDCVDERGGTLFSYAATRCHHGVMQRLVELGADVHQMLLNGRTALHHAVLLAKADTVKYLLDQGLQAEAVDEVGRSVFHYAALRGDISIMKLLIDCGVDFQATTNDGYTALDLAAHHGRSEVVKFLLSVGLGIDSPEARNSALRTAARKGDVRTMRALIEGGADAHLVGEDGWTLLHWSAFEGRFEAAKFLLDYGIAIDASGNDGETALHKAAQEGHIKTTRELIDRGADIHAVSKKRETVLHFGAYSGKSDVVKFLLDLGISVDTVEEDGSTVLHIAAVKGDIDTIRLCLDHAADVHATTEKGKTALHVGAKHGNHDAVRLLVKHGIAIDAKDEDGYTSLLEAARSGHVQTMQVLVELGADTHAQTKTLRNILHLAVERAHVDVLDYALQLGLDAEGHLKIGDELVTPLVLAFSSSDSKKAYKMAVMLCSNGATMDESDRQTALKAAGLVTSAGDDGHTHNSAESASWRSALIACVDHWIQERNDGTSDLTKIPIEVVNRGEASVKAYLADIARSTDDDRIHRCKICVVGPSQWGKTSLVQSLKTNQTFLTKLKDRTIGIDLTTWVDGVLNDPHFRLEITFWDFAGQDVYQAAHTLFYSERTLFVLVVDLDAYWKELQDAESKSDRASEAQMNRFVSAKIFRWVRSIFAHQSDAQFVVVGTKANCLEDACVVADVWEDLRDRLDHWKAAFAKGLDSDLLSARASFKSVKTLQSKVSKLASSEWLIADVTNLESIGDVRTAVQTKIISSELGFPMWKTYTKVVQYVAKRREIARSSATTKDRIQKSIVLFASLRRQLLREIEELDRDSCEHILRTLNDLGDVLWYEHDGAGVFKDCIIIDPKLVIDVVREVVRHDFSGYANAKPPPDGRIAHSLLSTFPLWNTMDVELMHAFKALLQYFKLAYPADADEMFPKSEIIIPAFWNAEPPQSTSARDKPRSTTPQSSVCDAFDEHRWCWEYEIPRELAETIFEQFAVHSHSSYLPRTIRGYCVEATCAEFASSISLIQTDSPRDVLRIEVSGVSPELSWYNMRFYLVKIEKVLEAYAGDAIWRFIVYRPTGSKSESRHPVGSVVKAVEDAILMGKGMDVVRERMPWMPPDMNWFVHKSWNDITLLQQLQMNHLIEEKLEVLRKLAIAGNTPRQFPALWSLEYIPEEQKVVLRMASDLSGRCYHVPIEINTGSPLLAQYSSFFNVGVSLFATVVGKAVPLPLAQKLVDSTISALNSKANNAEHVHNLIEKLNLLPTEPFDSRTNSKLSPSMSKKLLRDLLMVYNDSIDPLEISEIANLDCAVTERGEYVWAHAHEISVMRGKITRCSAPPVSWKDLDTPESNEASYTSVTAPSPSRASMESSFTGFKIGVSVETIEGLADWDWYKTYCKWQLYYRKSLKPLVVDVTPTNGDSSQAPSWRTMRTSIDAVTSVEMLRECRLMVQVKRRSRIGWTKVIGDGEVWLRDFFEGDLSPVDLQASVKVSLGSDRAVLIRLTNQA